MKRFQSSTLILLAGFGLIPAHSEDNLPVDSQGVVETMAIFESRELTEAKRRIEERKKLSIRALQDHYRREADAGNEAGALAIRKQIELLDDGRRRYTYGLDEVREESGAEGEKAKPRIPTTATRIGKHYYQLFGDRISREEAEARCAQMGGRLAIIRSEKIFEKYVDVIRKTYDFNACWTGAAFDKAKRRWIWQGDESTEFDERLLRSDHEIAFPDYDFLCMDVSTGELFSKQRAAKQTFLCEWVDEE